MNTETRFNNLTQNAIDFLNKALADIESEPKYAIIHFYAAVELFLKAKLFKEHWTLIVAKNHEPDWEKFKAGDFQSVSFKDAVGRLDKVVRSGLHDSEIKAFKEVGEHRNKMIHFYHDSQSQDKNDRLVKEAVTQLHRAWHYLHILLMVRWEETFKEWEGKFYEFDEKLRNYHTYLQAIFDTIQPNIIKLKSGGYWFTECPSCGFEAIPHNKEENNVYSASCKVCGLSRRYFNVKCPKCESILAIPESYEAICHTCGHELDLDELSEQLDAAGESANCSECSELHSVVCVDEGTWVCLSCHNFFDTIDQCQWCGDLSVGDMENSYFCGCAVCEGLNGWQSDKDD